MQCDEMWSFVANKGNKQWIWLALDVNTQEIVGVYVGARSRKGAQGLWDSVPSPTPVSGLPTMRSSPASGITVSARRVVKPAILSALIASYVSESPG